MITTSYEYDLVLFAVAVQRQSFSTMTTSSVMSQEFEISVHILRWSLWLLFLSPELIYSLTRLYHYETLQLFRVALELLFLTTFHGHKALPI